MLGVTSAVVAVSGRVGRGVVGVASARGVEDGLITIPHRVTGAASAKVSQRCYVALNWGGHTEQGAKTGSGSWTAATAEVFAAGDAVTVAVSYSGAGTLAAVTDAAGNTYSLKATVSSGGLTLAVYQTVSTALVTTPISLTWTALGTVNFALTQFVTGGLSPTPYVAGVTATGTGATATISDLSPVPAGCVKLLLLGWPATSTALFVPGTGGFQDYYTVWADAASPAPGGSLSGFDFLDSEAGLYSESADFDSSTAWVGVLVFLQGQVR